MTKKAAQVVMRLFRLGRKPSSKFYYWKQLATRHILLSTFNSTAARALWLRILALQALASSLPMPSALPLLKPRRNLHIHDRSSAPLHALAMYDRASIARLGRAGA